MKTEILASLAALTIAGTAYPATPPRLSEIRLHTGVRLEYAEQGPAQGPVIIALHGYSDSWFSFSGVMPLLADKYKFYALSLRGHGGSDKPATGYGMRDLAEDVIAFMDAKRITRATVIGHSMGSMVAQQVALAAPERVQRLILVGSGTDLKKFGDMDVLKEMVEALPEPVPEKFAREFQVSTIHHPIPPAFLERTIEESLKLPLRVWRELMKGMYDNEPALALGRSGVATLLLRGEYDAMALPAEQDALLRMIKSAKLKTYKDTGHAVHWERPEWFARDVAQFIEKGL